MPTQANHGKAVENNTCELYPAVLLGYKRIIKTKSEHSHGQEISRYFERSIKYIFHIRTVLRELYALVF